MANIIVPSRRISSAYIPQNARLNLTNPLTKNLQYINKNVVGLSSSYPTRAIVPGPVTNRGISDYDAHQIRYTWANAYRPSQGTLFVIPYFTTTDYKYGILGHQTEYNYVVNYNKAEIIWNDYWAGGILFNVVLGPTTHLQSYSPGGFIARGTPVALSGGTSGLRAYINGNLHAIAASTDWINTFTADTYFSTSFSYRNQGAGQTTYQPLLIGLVYDRQLSDFEIKSLSDNPGQIFEANANRVYFDPPIAQTTTAPAGTQAPYLVLPSRRKQGMQRLSKRFASPHALVFSAANGSQLVNRPNKLMYYSVLNSNYTGKRVVETEYGPSYYLWGDHGGLDDDKLTCPIQAPNGRTLGGLTTIYDITVNDGNFRELVGNQLPISISSITASSDSFEVGYIGGNGFNYYYQGTSQHTLLNKRTILVVSSDFIKQYLYIYSNGRKYTPNQGIPSYLGGGYVDSYDYTSFNIGGGGAGFTNYYSFIGEVRLFAVFPGLVLNEEEVRQVSIDPSSIFESNKSRTYFDQPVSVTTPIYASPLAIAGGELLQATSIPLNNLGSGTPDETKYLRGDGVWALPVATADADSVLELNNLGGL